MAKKPMQEWARIGSILNAVGRPWATMGAIATRPYRPERTTLDFDVLIRPEELTAFEEGMLRAGFRRDRDLVFPHQPRWGGSSWNRSADEMDVDLIAIDLPWVEDAIHEAGSALDAEGLPILPLRYLVLTKIEWMRGKDVTDLAEVLGVAVRRGDEDSLERTRRLLRRYLPHLEEDYDQLLQLGEWEIGPE